MPPSFATLDPTAAQRWLRRPATESPWLHEEVARRMEDRLNWIKPQPNRWLHWSPLTGGLQAHGLLVKRYPKATCTVLETTDQQAQFAKQALTPTWWKRLGGAAPTVVTSVTQPVQMLWANMVLHAEPNPAALLARWHDALTVDGFLMFSCLGPDTLKSLRTIYQQMGWPPPAHELTDMHDWGDMLLATGFAEPVMDMERITLSFETPLRLLNELRGLGRNLHRGRFGALRGKQWHAQWLQAVSQSPLELGFEVIYGHAFKPAPQLNVGLQSTISLESMRAELARGKAGGASYRDQR